MTLLNWPNYRLFDYEYELARREVSALLPNLETTVASSGVRVAGQIDDSAIDRLTYFAEVMDSEARRVPLQARVEATHQRVTGRRTGKQSTRFLVHDLHEYKGKFNPQMARALINVFGTSADVIIDPFSGSGTTAIEALRLGKSAVALDMNPLAAWMTAVKGRVMTHEDPVSLAVAFGELCAAAREVTAGTPLTTCDDHYDTLWTDSSVDYLHRWFPSTSLAPMYRVLRLVEGRTDVAADLLRLAVSSVTREVSWQLPEDLRIRRRPPSWVPPHYGTVLETALVRISRALTECAEAGRHAQGTLDAAAGDARAVHDTVAATVSGRKAIITSPPYATALPYIDTDRLSLVALGLSEPSDVRVLESELTGSREWSPRTGRSWASRMSANADGVPDDVLDVCEAVIAKNTADGAGFRRQAVPALLYRYFCDMSASLRSWAKVLAPGEHAVLVIGANRTGGRTDPILIDTPTLTATCAEAEGFTCVEQIPFEVWARYGLHAKNGVSGESAVVLKRL